jgi:CHASE2 domain-containing sensor protein
MKSETKNVIAWVCLFVIGCGAITWGGFLTIAFITATLAYIIVSALSWTKDMDDKFNQNWD